MMLKLSKMASAILLVAACLGCQNANVSVSGLIPNSNYVANPSPVYFNVGTPAATLTNGTYVLTAKVADKKTTILTNGSYTLTAQAVK